MGYGDDDDEECLDDNSQGDDGSQVGERVRYRAHEGLASLNKMIGLDDLSKQASANISQMFSKNLYMSQNISPSFLGKLYEGHAPSFVNFLPANSFPSAIEGLASLNKMIGLDDLSKQASANISQMFSKNLYTSQYISPSFLGKLYEGHMPSFVNFLPANSFPSVNFSLPEVLWSSAIRESVSGVTEVISNLRRLHFNYQLRPGFFRLIFPANLRDVVEDVGFGEIDNFINQEGISLYLVPRGRTVLRLLHAQNRAARYRVLNNCYESIIDDCADVLRQIDDQSMQGWKKFAFDGIEAMKAGCRRSAQALFTVVLDSMIREHVVDKHFQRLITNCKKGASVPEDMDEMDFQSRMVFLSILNSHEQFWKDKGDEVPPQYSRHASVHGVSARQFTKPNCVQALMLVTSLIGYIDRYGSRPGSKVERGTQ